METQDTMPENKRRVFSAQMGEIVSEEDMMPIQVQGQEIGGKIETKIGATILLNRPEMPASAQNPVPLHPASMCFRLTAQGWQRVARPKPSILTPLMVWIVAFPILLVLYWRHHASDGPNAAETDQSMQALFVFIWVVIGPIMWAWEWWQYKHSSD